MLKSLNNIILASGSPRRSELLKMLDLDFKVIVSNVEEVVDSSLSYKDIVTDLAYQKALDVFKNNKESIVLGFDTLVILDDNCLGKPISKNDAFNMLKQLSGKTHIVITGCSIISKKRSIMFFDEAEVKFIDITDDELNEYLTHDEYKDKAGSYAIQGLAAKFIESINGDYYSIMGLPVSKLYKELKKMAKE